ncbi:hypothetical protein BV163_008800 [Haemophilus influenzae]|uniref:Uncharacterized protein n=1 Tax=Haemophilus influenzae TaxID=727 RepID=A0A2S9S088_HAEIF|nr:hypothetical protein [Haemophilus influenzae]PRK64418.1 hypothetical protein BV163_01404 [Haemophilus influenzae]
MKKYLLSLPLFFISFQAMGGGDTELSDAKQMSKFYRESRVEIKKTHSPIFMEWKYKYDLLQAQYDKVESDFQNRSTKGSMKKSGTTLTDDEYRQLIHNIDGKKTVSRYYPDENTWMNLRFYNPLDKKIRKIEIKFIEDINRYKDATNETLAKNTLFRDIYWRISDENKDKSVDWVYLEAKKLFLAELEKQISELIIRIDVNAEPYTMKSVNFEFPTDFDIKQWEVNKLFGE